jgi:HSP20 family protein
MAKEEKALRPVAAGSNIERRSFADMDKVFEDWFEDFLSRPIPRLWRPDFWRLRRIGFESPALDIYEDKDALIVKAEIPGLTKDEIDISLDGKMLTIKGEKKKEEEVKEEHYYRCERTFGAFSRAIELPVKVTPDNVNASFKNGLLEIRLPKADDAKKNVVKVKVA